MAKRTKKSTKSAKRSSEPVKREYTGPILVLKSTKAGGEPHVNGTSNGNGGVISTQFRWPRSGRVQCDDWDPRPECGNGLHGLEWAEGTWGLMREDETPADEWRVVCVQPADLVRLTDGGNVKVKFRCGEVVYCGDKAGALAYAMCSPEAMTRAQVLAADPQSGDSSTAASSGDSSTAASSGNYSTAASSGYSSTADQSGKSGIAAAIGNKVRAKAGEDGLLILTWWDDSTKRYRAVVGECGIDGIESGVWYCVKDGKLSKVE